MSDWNPEAYLTHADPRLRPAQDLLAHIDASHPKKIIDLGCGPGNATRLLARRWPDSAILGIDNAPEMLARAREENAQWTDAAARNVTFAQGDIAEWSDSSAPDVIFSNAALHWLDAHERLLPRLFAMLAPGGILAVQMPHNHQAPSHTEIAAVASDGPWARTLRPRLRPSPVASVQAYWEILSPVCPAPDIWETTYLHVLHGDDAVFSWVSSTVLAPLRNALDDALRTRFEETVRMRLARAYPKRDDASTLFPFTRLFIVAKKPAEEPATEPATEPA